MMNKLKLQITEKDEYIKKLEMDLVQKDVDLVQKDVDLGQKDEKLKKLTDQIIECFKLLRVFHRFKIDMQDENIKLEKKYSALESQMRRIKNRQPIINMILKAINTELVEDMNDYIIEDVVNCETDDEFEDEVVDEVVDEAAKAAMKVAEAEEAAAFAASEAISTNILRAILDSL
jgi:hypothetical protein